METSLHMLLTLAAHLEAIRLGISSTATIEIITAEPPNSDLASGPVPLVILTLTDEALTEQTREWLRKNRIYSTDALPGGRFTTSRYTGHVGDVSLVLNVRTSTAQLRVSA